MNVGGVTTNVPIGYKANKSAQSAGMDSSTHFNNVAKKGHTVYMKTDDMLYTISANLTEKTGAIRLKDMWKSKYPGAYYHVMDGSKISQATWDRNDFPFEKFFSDDVDESILEWRPAGAEPSDYDSTVITRRNSVAGQKAVIVHPALEEKMKNNPELAEKVMQNVENWIATYPAEPGCSYLIELNENGGISKYCVTGPLRISHSVTETGREKVDKLHEEYERIARENAMKRGTQQQTVKKDVGSATAEYKEKHPEQAGRVNGQIRAGQNVIRKFGAENVSREDMTMEEYKAFFTALMNSIPYDASQQGDVNVWSITEAGWEQMKNDPDYEAWVLGYTAQDRAVYNPFAAMPGYSSRFHTEHFGASIDEHIGQSMPMGASSRSRFDDGETWWEWRQKRMKALSQNLLMRSHFLN